MLRRARRVETRLQLGALPLALLLTLPLQGGCVGESGTFGPRPDIGGGGQEAGPPADQGGARDYPTVYACDTIDIIFVIDNSNSMQQEQDNLILNFSKFVQRIEAIQPQVKSYRIGVISTDIGAGPYQGGLMGSCVPGGDDGKLLHAPAATATGCAASYPRWLEGPGPTVAQDFACLAALGVGGCGYEQQLEAALRALTVQSYNQGFVRSNAPIAIIFITDEDDCSAQDTKLFDPDDASLGPYPTRCVQHLNKLYPVTRYIQGFKQLKDNDKRVVVAAITGPAGKVTLDSTQSQVLPACSSTEFGSSLPGNRFAALVKGFGARGVLENLCQGDLATPLTVIGKAIERACLE